MNHYITMETIDSGFQFKSSSCLVTSIANCSETGQWVISSACSISCYLRHCSDKSEVSAGNYFLVATGHRARVIKPPCEIRSESFIEIRQPLDKDDTHVNGDLR